MTATFQHCRLVVLFKGEACVKRISAVCMPAHDSLPSCILYFVNTGDPITLVEVHVDQFGSSVPVQVDEIENRSVCFLKIAVGLKRYRATVFIKRDRQYVTRRRQT